MFKELNPLLHSELRLAVVSILIGVESADFVFIRQQTGATAGNLSVQLDKLAKAGYWFSPENVISNINIIFVADNCLTIKQNAILVVPKTEPGR